jgi:hypothetical protein
MGEYLEGGCHGLVNCSCVEELSRSIKNPRMIGPDRNYNSYSFRTLIRAKLCGTSIGEII